MLFNKLTVLALLPVLAVATPTPQDPQSCTVGSLQCCQSTQSASTVSSSPLAPLLALLGIVLGDLTGEVGATCSPITGIGAGGTSCTAQPVCCTNNSFNGLVALGCSPVSL